jgi:multidrug efflux pump subunit AcrA (membrane-fusion protein)/YHS domain-containing protein
MLLIISFVGGIRVNQFGASHNTPDTGTRRILHYVDPMNPANTSAEPGIAPCGMPMEAVYADDDMPGSKAPAVLGTVKINQLKQQSIGVQTGEVVKTAETAQIRALGRIVPDENRVYALIAGTDGWMGEVHGSTTGSMVSKDQLMAKIKIYNYDFYTWQQRYLTELGNSGRRRVFVSTTSGASEQLQKILAAEKKAGALLPDVGGPIALPSEASPNKNTQNEEPPPRNTTPSPSPTMATVSAEHHPVGSPAKDPGKSWGIPPGTTSYGEIPTDMKQSEAFPAPLGNPGKPIEHTKKMKNMAAEGDTGLPFIREDDILYASKARQELLNFGVGESQLAQLAKSGTYVTSIELRSPADGLVLGRNVTPRQRIDRGTECFRIADLSKVWIEADIYDTETKFIQPGSMARVSLPKQKHFYAAQVTEFLPRFNATTRTLKVRLEMDNPQNSFRPDMFVDVEFMVNLPEAHVVPAAAVIDSGKNKTVYVVKGEGNFEPRMVKTGWQFNDRVEIVEGLQPGEKIVVSGNFLIDSESRMKLAAARLMTDTVVSPGKELPMSASESTPSHPPHHATTNPDGLATTKDPVCGMTVDPETAKAAGLTVVTQGKTFYFCSRECVDEYHRHGPPDSGPAASQPMSGGTQGSGAHHHD